MLYQSKYIQQLFFFVANVSSLCCYNFSAIFTANYKIIKTTSNTNRQTAYRLLIKKIQQTADFIDISTLVYNFECSKVCKTGPFMSLKEDFVSYKFFSLFVLQNMRSKLFYFIFPVVKRWD